MVVRVHRIRGLEPGAKRILEVVSDDDDSPARAIQALKPRAMCTRRAS
jgi:hypothetical protein